MTEPRSDVPRLRLKLLQGLLVVLLVAGAAIVVRLVAPAGPGSTARPATPHELSIRLSDPAGHVRASAVSELASRARLGDVQAARMLLDTAANDAEVGIRQVALEALADACPARAVVPLVRVAGDPAEAVWARTQAIHRLGLMGRGESVGVLLSLARKGQPEVRDAARNALAAFGVPDDTQRHRELRGKMLRVIPKVQFDDIDLRDTITFGGEYADAPVFIARPGAAAKTKPLDTTAKVSVDLRNVPVGYYLWEVIRQVKPASDWGLRWFGDVMAVELIEGAPDPNDWEIASPAGNNPADDAVFEKLSRRIERLSFLDIELEDVITFLREYSEAEIVVGWRSLEGIGVEMRSQVSIDVLDVSVSQAMKMTFASVADRGKITCEISGGKVVVSAER